MLGAGTVNISFESCIIWSKISPTDIVMDNFLGNILHDLENWILNLVPF